MCGAYYIGGREFNSLSVLIGYYTGWSDLLKNKRLVHPVPPPEVGLFSLSYRGNELHVYFFWFNNYMA